MVCNVAFGVIGEVFAWQAWAAWGCACFMHLYIRTNGLSGDRRSLQGLQHRHGHPCLCLHVGVNVHQNVYKVILIILCMLVAGATAAWMMLAVCVPALACVLGIWWADAQEILLDCCGERMQCCLL